VSRRSATASTLTEYEDEHTGIWVYPLSADEQRAYLEAEREARREKQQKVQETINRALRRTRLKSEVEKPASEAGN
jgi:hypothetical protein